MNASRPPGRVGSPSFFFKMKTALCFSTDVSLLHSNFFLSPSPSESSNRDDDDDDDIWTMTGLCVRMTVIYL